MFTGERESSRQVRDECKQWSPALFRAMVLHGSFLVFSKILLSACPVAAFFATPRPASSQLTVLSHTSQVRWDQRAGLLRPQHAEEYARDLRVYHASLAHYSEESPVVADAAGSVMVADEWDGFRDEDHERFLRDFWQKKPLLIRGAMPGLQTLLSKDELVNLARCEDVDSRIVRGGISVDDGSHKWEVQLGPFEEEVFAKIDSESHWTLLVNDVNRHVPEVSDILSNFRFVPNWRIDDVMVSYAQKGGSIGPHVDNYDVFLVQGAGKRRWSIEEAWTSDEEERARCVEDIDLRVLADYREAQSWVLEPGDALYLPPRLAHYGLSLSQDCMTFSIGFRAPSSKELLTFFGEHAASVVAKPDDLYKDPDLRKQDNPGLIDRQAIVRAKGMIREALLAALDDGDAFDHWLGSHVTRSRRDHEGYPMAMDDDEGLSFGYQMPEDVTDALLRRFRRDRDALARGGQETRGGDNIGPFVYQAEGLTFAYVQHESKEGGATLFVDGNAFHLPPKLAFVGGLVCGSPRMSPRDLGPSLEGEQGEGVAKLLHELLKEGYLYPADD